MASNGTLEEIASGVTIKHLTQEKLRNLEIAIPPLDQQHEIVERIESALARIDSVTEQLAQISRKGILLRRATLLDAHKRGINGHDFRTETLRNLGTWVGGSTPSKSENAYWNGGTVPWITSKDVKTEFIFGSSVNVTERAIGSSLLKIHPAGSVVLVARSGILEHTLPIAQAQVDFTLNQDLKACVPKDGIDPEWLLRLLQAHEKELLQNYKKAGTTVANLNFDEFLEYEVSVPPIEVQRNICHEISRRMQLIDELTTQTELRVSEMDTLRRTVLHQAFNEREVISV
jgi:type I restriction enzyme S subunit